MPNFKRLSLDLTKVDDWVVEDNKHSAIQDDYSQKPNPPKVNWTINTVTTLEGSKSINLFDRGNGLRFPPGSTNSSNLYTMDILIDKVGNVSYLYIDGSLTVGETVSIKTYAANSSYEEVLKCPITTPTFLHQRHTVFQNRTILMYAIGDLVPFPNKIGFDGQNFAFLDLNLVESSVEFHTVTGTSLAQGEKNGITSWGNYVILWDATTLYWSDPNVFTEFTVGGSSLAGSQSISEGKGNIITIVPNAQGLVIYLQANIVQASYSGDAANPWIFTEITGGGGLLLLDGQPLVTRGEDTAFQVAYTTKGLQRIGPQEAASLPERISDFVLRNYVEEKAVGSSAIERTMLFPGDVKRPKIKQLALYDNYLFLSTGSAEPFIQQGFDNKDLGRLYTFDLSTGKMGIHAGDFLAVVPELELINFSNTAALQERNRIYADSFMVTRRINLNSFQVVRNSVFDFSNHSNIPITQDAWVQREAELFIGNITMGTRSITELIGVTLVGDTSLIPQSEGGDDATRARVFVYTEFRAKDAPIELKYNAKMDKYLGLVVGNELQVEVRGQYFYLTNVLIDVQSGGQI